MAKDLNQSISKTVVKDKAGTAEAERDIVMTDYVATRWYRAPEILVGSTKYTKGVDMWAIGCIFGEMLMGKPLFPGSSTINQLGKVVTLTGMPSDADMESLGSPFTKVMVNSLGNVERKPLREYFPNAEEEGLDLLNSLLQFNPNKRITTVEALSHPYLASFHKSSVLPSLSRAISIPVCDNIKYDLINYRHLIYKFIQHSNAGSGKPAPSSASSSSNAAASFNGGMASGAGGLNHPNGQAGMNGAQAGANVRFYSISDEDQSIVNRRAYSNSVPASLQTNASSSGMAGIVATVGGSVSSGMRPGAKSEKHRLCVEQLNAKKGSVLKPVQGYGGFQAHPKPAYSAGFAGAAYAGYPGVVGANYGSFGLNSGSGQFFKESKVGSIFPLCKFVPKKNEPYPKSGSLKPYYHHQE